MGGARKVDVYAIRRDLVLTHLRGLEVAQSSAEIQADLCLSRNMVEIALQQLRNSGRIEPVPGQLRPLRWRVTGSSIPAPEPVRQVSAAQWEDYLRGVLHYARTNDEALDRYSLIYRERNPMGHALLDRALRELADAGLLVKLGEVDGVPYYCTPEDAQ
jgi:DNA-binding HxlR family transcriptional regulator